MIPTPIPRQPVFDVSQTSVHWIPDDPFASQVINVLHLMLPPGERMFCRAFRLALPALRDETLIAQVRAFIRQEASHARAHHDAASGLLVRHGIETATYTNFIEWLVSKGPLAEHPFGYTLPERWQQNWLCFGVGVVASIEHITCILGQFLLDNTSWARAGADPEMTALLKWHGAEEIEHRCVAFDVHHALGAGYASRPVLLIFGLPLLTALLFAGATHILDQDPVLGRERLRPWKPSFWRHWRHSVRAGHLPSMSWMLRQHLRYLSPRYNPEHEGNTAQAMAFLSAMTPPTSRQLRDPSAMTKQEQI
ncbi:MAG: metal-dependent hydrolase [Pseudomonadota bacterium]